MINKGTQIPPIREVVAAADFFDQMGDFESARLLDDYIEKTAEYDGDIVKMAGFWANVWKRLKGRAKMWFYSEYKELYNAAKDAQEKIQERVHEAEKSLRELKSLVKNHDLQDWRLKLDQMKILNTKDITEPFDVIYGRFLSYIIKFKDKQDKGGAVSLTPSEKIERMTTGVSPEGVDWMALSKDNKIFADQDFGMMKIDKSGMLYRKSLQHVPDMPGHYVVREDRGSKLMRQWLGDVIWQKVGEDDTYLYFKAVSKKKAPAEKPEKPPKGPTASEPKPIEPMRAPPPPAGSPPSVKPPVRKREPEPATGVLSPVEELEAELTGKQPEPAAPPPEQKKNVPEAAAPAGPEKTTESPQAGRPKPRRKSAWFEVVSDGPKFRREKGRDPGARIFAWIRTDSPDRAKGTHRRLDLDDETDKAIIEWLERKGPEAKRPKTRVTVPSGTDFTSDVGGEIVPAEEPPAETPEKTEAPAEPTERVWAEVIGGPKLRAARKGDPKAKLYEEMPRQEIAGNPKAYREVDEEDETDAGARDEWLEHKIKELETQKGSGEKTASDRKMRLGKLISLMSE